jgi:glutamate-1-semialdehyde 2,1-aminomutase
MFSVYFNASPVRDLATAISSDSKTYGRFFHGALSRGVFLAPSAFEAAFLSTAHTDAIIDRSCEALSAALAAL